MKPQTDPRARAFTLLELMLVIAAVAVVVAIVLPGLSPHRHNHDPIIRCVNNLKQVGLSFRLWAGDNGEKYPMHVSTNQGGTMELISEAKVAPHFVVLSNELGTPKLLTCWVDHGREIATNFASVQDTNISYFLSFSATEANPEAWLAGDRNLVISQTAAQGLVVVNANTPASWSDAMHKGRGAVAFADGSVRQLTARALIDSLRAQSNAAGRLAFPD